MGWICEFIAILSRILQVHQFKIPNLHIKFDCTIMYILIPFLHLLNDEETNGIITDENWYQGMKNLLGIYVPPEKRKEITQPDHIPKQNRNPSLSKSVNSTSALCNLTQNRHKLIQRTFSTPILLPSNKQSPMKKGRILKRQRSLPMQYQKIIHFNRKPFYVTNILYHQKINNQPTTHIFYSLSFFWESLELYQHNAYKLLAKFSDISQNTIKNIYIQIYVLTVKMLSYL